MGKIHKITKNGQTIYPATTTDAVAHPTLKVPVSKLIGEINVSNLFPTGRRYKMFVFERRWNRRRMVVSGRYVHKH